MSSVMETQTLQCEQGSSRSICTDISVQESSGSTCTDVSEYLSNAVSLPFVPEYERYSFGELYEQKLCELIHNHLELSTDDHLCYVGEPRGSIIDTLKKNFCLLHPVARVLPGHIHAVETSENISVPIKLPHVGAEEFFRDEAHNPARFDKILMRDAIQYMTDTKQAFENAMKTVRPMGKLLIIHRPAPMNTLPLFRSAVRRIQDVDHSYARVIQDLQALNFDVKWEIEFLPIIMPKLKWLSMLQDRYPPQLEAVSNFEIQSGIRELTQGMLKYEGEYVEFADRLLFITAQHTLFDTYPSIQRFGARCMEPFPGLVDLKFQMELTEDMKTYLRQQKRQQKRQAAAKHDPNRCMEARRGK